MKSRLGGVGVIEASSGALGLVAAAYGLQLKVHGTTPSGVLWSSFKRQQSQFALLVRIVSGDARRTGFSINDLGCGYGALFDFLDCQGLMRAGRYVGYDICADMVEAARRRIGDRRATFLHSMVATRPADYSIASGTFNFMGPAAAPDWTDYVKESLLALWTQSGRGIAFNLLDRDRRREPVDWLYYSDTDAMLDFCRRNMSPEVKRIDGLFPMDCTFLVRRTGHPRRRAKKGGGGGSVSSDRSLR